MDDSVELDKRILLAFYRQEEPQSATDEKVSKVIRSFQKKATKSGGDWRELMYAAFAQQRGVDPRAHWEALQKRVYDNVELDQKILLAFYQAEEPQSATEEKVSKVIRSFQKKAEKAGGGDWREMMYGAFTAQRGLDPRIHWESLGQQQANAPAQSVAAPVAEPAAEQKKQGSEPAAQIVAPAVVPGPTLVEDVEPQPEPSIYDADQAVVPAADPPSTKYRCVANAAVTAELSGPTPHTASRC